jgi:predicted acetyltransferase
VLIKQITINDLRDLKKEAVASGLVFCKTAKLFALFVDNDIIAFAGILFYKNKAVFKNQFVKINSRGKGYFKALFVFRLDMCRNLNIKVVEATCTEMSLSLYLKSGFKIVKKFKHYTKVRNENIQQ